MDIANPFPRVAQVVDNGPSDHLRTPFLFYPDGNVPALPGLPPGIGGVVRLRIQLVGEREVILKDC